MVPTSVLPACLGDSPSSSHPRNISLAGSTGRAIRAEWQRYFPFRAVKTKCGRDMLHQRAANTTPRRFGKSGTAKKLPDGLAEFVSRSHRGLQCTMDLSVLRRAIEYPATIRSPSLRWRYGDSDEQIRPQSNDPPEELRPSVAPIGYTVPMPIQFAPCAVLDQ